MAKRAAPKSRRGHQAADATEVDADKLLRRNEAQLDRLAARLQSQTDDGRLVVTIPVKTYSYGTLGGYQHNWDQCPSRMGAEKCAFCKEVKPPKQLQVCARCQAVHYCGRDCQRRHWKEHKKTCTAAAAKVPEEQRRARLRKKRLECYARDLQRLHRHRFFLAFAGGMTLARDPAEFLRRAARLAYTAALPAMVDQHHLGSQDVVPLNGELEWYLKSLGQHAARAQLLKMLDWNTDPDREDCDLGSARLTATAVVVDVSARSPLVVSASELRGGRLYPVESINYIHVPPVVELGLINARALHLEWWSSLTAPELEICGVRAMRLGGAVSIVQQFVLFCSKTREFVPLVLMRHDAPGERRVGPHGKVIDIRPVKDPIYIAMAPLGGKDFEGSQLYGAVQRLYLADGRFRQWMGERRTDPKMSVVLNHK